MAKLKELSTVLTLMLVLAFTVSQSMHSHHQHGGGSSSGDEKKGIPKQILENWASNFGGQLFRFGVSVTKYDELQNRFNSAPGTDVRQINLASMIVEMVHAMNSTLNKRVEAIKKIKNWAEERALEFNEKSEENRPKPPNTYYNSKKLNVKNDSDDELYHSVVLNFDAHFNNDVNTSFSSVHVPTNIYEQKQDVLEAIEWSRTLDGTFQSNYNHNPNLNYQYFGSASGFLRHYPAMKWPNVNDNRDDPDLYDCRTRPWYVQTANSPKNMFILHDVSGSMTGIRREIAKHVVNTLLDTLTENDYVNVYNFSDSTTPVVPCFKNKLVQANLENIRELKVGLEQDHTAGIANFTSALNTAFDILNKSRLTNESSDCNQAIMIITDGAPFFFDEIFAARQNPEHFVRVFTYLIGREVTEKREVKQMACSNRGYFSHVSTLSEVQEKVLKYMPIMSRPLVIFKAQDISWTPVYANIADTRRTDWTWLDHNARMQYKRSKRYKQFLKRYNDNNSFLFYKNMFLKKYLNETAGEGGGGEDGGEEDEFLDDYDYDTSEAELKWRVNRILDVDSAEQEQLLRDDPIIASPSTSGSYKQKKQRNLHHNNRQHHQHKPHNNQRRGNNKKRRKRNVIPGIQSDNIQKTMTNNNHQLTSRIITSNDNSITNNKNDLKNQQRDSNTDDSKKDPVLLLALPISAKKVESRLKKVHGVVYSDYRNILKAEKEEYYPTPARPKDPTEPFDFIISAGVPVFDNRNSTIIYEHVRVNATYTYKKPIEERIAVFLGVAATDIPIKELKKIASPFKLGVNGYAFMVNNNGYVVFHPDWRPVFNGELLKPNYNTVDFSEVELVDKDNNFRNNDSDLLEMRNEMIDSDRSYRKALRIRVHQDNFADTDDTELNDEPNDDGGGDIGDVVVDDDVIPGGGSVVEDGVVEGDLVVDDVVKEEETYVPYYNFRVRKVRDYFRRVSIRTQMYEFHKIPNIPYTLGIAAPQQASRFIGELELRLQQENVLDYFNKSTEPRKWKINPDWNYCDFIRGGERHKFDSPEDQLVYFLKLIQGTKGGSWAWKNVGAKHRHPGHQGGENRWHTSGMGSVPGGDGHNNEIYECDKELVQSLAFDANVTQIFKEMNLWKFDKNDKDLLKMNGVTSAFVATRTGLTRWMDFTSTSDAAGARYDSSEDTVKFIHANSGATNELWYKRAVERYEHDPESFVYSVPFDAGTRNDSRVTATRAIFVTNTRVGHHAPVAVVGVQFNHSQWASRFFDITSGSFDARPAGTEPKWSCSSGRYDCFVLDDNGFILYSSKHEDTGRFFGEVDGMVMEMLVNSDVYKRVRVVDYQAVCFQPVAKTNFASGLRTPIIHLTNLFNWLLAQLAWTILNLNLHNFINPDYASVLASMIDQTVVEEEIGTSLPPYIQLASINKTRLRPCDKETFLYTYGSGYNSHNFSYHGLLTKCGPSGCNGHFNVHYIPYTNLILVATDGSCRCNLNSTTIRQREVQYRNVFSSSRGSSSSSSSSREEDYEEEDTDELLSSSPVEVCRTPKPSLYRKRPAVCINYNPEEETLAPDCGRSSPTTQPTSVMVLMILTTISIMLTSILRL